MQHIKNYKIFESNFKEDIQTELIQAGYDSDLDRIKKLVQQGADVNYNEPTRFGTVRNTPLLIVIAYGKIDSAELFIRLGANVSYVNDKGKNIIDIFPFYSRYAVQWISSYRIQKLLLNKDQSLYNSFKEHGIKIHPRILQEFPHLDTAIDLNLL